MIHAQRRPLAWTSSYQGYRNIRFRLRGIETFGAKVGLRISYDLLRYVGWGIHPSTVPMQSLFELCLSMTEIISVELIWGRDVTCGKNLEVKFVHSHSKADPKQIIELTQRDDDGLTFTDDGSYFSRHVSKQVQ